MSLISNKVVSGVNLPSLPYDSWKDTLATLHMWTQIVGKIRLALTPLVNHWWNVTLYVTARGLTTSPMPYGDRTLEIAFDFIEHNLLIETSDGRIIRLDAPAPPAAGRRPRRDHRGSDPAGRRHRRGPRVGRRR